mmetsp:Transcript_14499/g.20006  ORF Transcript_14499/g.20006 Transcript_14499/m.20006 type:complete len:494 (-) Transcript_14499:337-1818(-)
MTKWVLYIAIILIFQPESSFSSGFFRSEYSVDLGRHVGPAQLPPSIQQNANTDGCPDNTSSNAGLDCEFQWSGRVLRRVPKGPQIALLQPVKEEAHAASIVELKNGMLVMAWFSGVEGQPGVAIVVSRLDRKLNQWETPKVVSEDPSRSNQNPVLFVDPETDTIHLIHSSQEGGKYQDTSRLMWLNSTDGGAHWTAPWVHPSFQGKVGAFVKGRILSMEHGRFIADNTSVLLDGGTPVNSTIKFFQENPKGRHGGRLGGFSEWLLPMYYTPEARPESHYCALWRSFDSGRTWGQEALMSRQLHFLAQPSVVKMPSTGYLRAFFRDRQGHWIYYSESTDNGRSWPEKHVQSVLPNDQSGIQALVLRSGHLVIAFNNQACTKDAHSGQLSCERYPLSLALSVDEGRSWGWVRDLEPGGPNDLVEPKMWEKSHYQRYSYPSLIQTADGLIHVAYTYRKKTIKYVVVEESWIQRSHTTGVYQGEHQFGSLINNNISY